MTTLSKLPFILIVAGDSPYKSVADLTAYLKEKGDKASYGRSPTPALVSSELYKAISGSTTVEVKYKDAGAMLNDLWGHNIVFAHIDPVTAAAPSQDRQTARAGDFIQGAVQALPDIPSAAEAGHQEFRNR